jgi:hypothetical protein
LFLRLLAALLAESEVVFDGIAECLLLPPNRFVTMIMRRQTGTGIRSPAS